MLTVKKQVDPLHSWFRIFPSKVEYLFKMEMKSLISNRSPQLKSGLKTPDANLNDVQSKMMYINDNMMFNLITGCFIIK